MASVNNTTTTLFMPTVNVLQEHSLDKRLSINIDFQNNDLYVLQELTRCAALLNYIYNNNNNHDNHRNNNMNFTTSNHQSKVNGVFDTFLQINDPLAIFIDNFEQFFGMYIHSKYGRNNFKLYMKECEKSPVAYPINVFEESMCIFMQYNRNELRTYIYNILTMFYYYTGSNFYEMICPLNKIPRSNLFDEYSDSKMNSLTTTTINGGGGGGGIKRDHESSKLNKRKSREEKLCILNQQNYNLNRPYFEHINPRHLDVLSTNAHFNKCILTSKFHAERKLDDVIINIGKTKPLIADTNPDNEHTLVPGSICQYNGINQNTRIYQISEHLQRSRNSEIHTITSPAEENERNFSHQAANRSTYVQTNFNSVWSCEHRRQLVALNIVYSIMNVCIQKITFSLLETKQQQYMDSLITPQQQQQQQQSSSSSVCDKIFTCMKNPNTISNINDIDDDDNNDIITSAFNSYGGGAGGSSSCGGVDGSNSDNRRKNNSYSMTMKNHKISQFIKPKRATIEVSFNQVNNTKKDQHLENLQFSI